MKSNILYLGLLFFTSCDSNSSSLDAIKPETNQTHLTLTDITSHVKIHKSSFKKLAPVVRRDSINNYLVDLIGDKIYDIWKGTPWSFNGTTGNPGKGSIACGYFVTTVLNNIGYNIPRIKYAICPSLEMIKKASGNKSVENHSGKSSADLRTLLLSRGKAVYITGLDFHTGFIVCDGSEVFFLHSNFIKHEGVIKDPIIHSASFNSSKTCWLGCISSNEYFQNNWLVN